MRTNPILACVAAVVLSSGGLLRAEDAPPERVVGAFLDEVRAGRGEAAVDAAWDGTSVARATFAPRWDALPEVERKEIARLAAALVAHDLLASLARGGDASDLVLGPPERRGTEGEPALVAVRVVAKSRKDPASTLLFRVSGGRVTDYRWDDAESAFAVEYVPRVTRDVWRGPDDPLLIAHVEWGRAAGRTPSPDSALYAPRPAPAPEWATRDLPEVDLAVVPGAPPDVRLDVSPDARWGPRVVVGVLSDGRVLFRGNGRRSPWKHADLMATDEEAARAAKSELRGSLADAAAASPLRLVVRADASARWDVAHTVAALASSQPDVAAREVAFVTRGSADDRPGVVSIAASAFRADADPAVSRGLDVRLFRKRKEDPSNAFTRVRVDGTTTFDLPAGRWTGVPAQDAARAAAHDAIFREIGGALRRHALAPGGRKEVAVNLPPPDGPSVPVADVLRTFQTIRDAGLEVVHVWTEER